MKTGKEKSRSHGQVVSAIPGRLRIKLHPSKRRHDVMDGIKSGLDSREGIHDVKINRSTGSITVKYDHGRLSTDNVLGTLGDLDVVFQSLNHEMNGGGIYGGSDDASASAGFLEAVNDLNRKLQCMTRVSIDLKVIMPLAFAGAGLWSISKRGLMIEAVPGWLFLWFAFDMFVKLHPSEKAKAK